MATIVLTTVLSLNGDFGLMAVFAFARTVTSLLGYFDWDSSPFSVFCRSNGVGLFMLIGNLASLLFGFQTLSMSFLFLMMVNLYDVWQAATVDMHPPR